MQNPPVEMEADVVYVVKDIPFGGTVTFTARTAEPTTRSKHAMRKAKAEPSRHPGTGPGAKRAAKRLQEIRASHKVTEPTTVSRQVMRREMRKARKRSDGYIGRGWMRTLPDGTPAHG